MSGEFSVDHLLGGEGDDILEGGEHGDWLWGGSDNDTFVYNTGDGGDIIYDFTKGEDMIELSYNGIADWGELRDYISSDTDGTAIITFSEDDSIILSGVDAANLEASDFAFA